MLEGAETCDAILSSGGVSMGDVDLVRVVLDDIGEMRWMQVAIRPAKPFAFGLVRGVPVFGLPGNPVSSLVSYELLARPAIRRLAGHPDDRLQRPQLAAVAVDGLERRPDGKLHLVRVVIGVGADGRLEAAPPADRARTRWGRWPLPTGWRSWPTAPASPPLGTVPVLLTGELA